MNWYLAVLRNYTGFTGRAHRTEYWMFALVNAVIYLVLEILAIAAHSPFVYVLLGIYVLAVLLPGLAVAARRLHDTDKSFAWILIALVPFVGGIVLLVFMCLPGTPGPNKYGTDPKALAQA